MSTEKEYVCKTATRIQEITDLIERGYEYVTTVDGQALFFRKPK